MKFLSGLLKFIAGGLMLLLVVFLPITLVVQGAGSLLLSPGKMVELLDENIIDVKVIASFAESELDRRVSDQDQNNPFVRIAVDGLKYLDHQQWLELVRLIAPPDLINQTIREVLVGYYRWIDGPNNIPRITVDLQDWKSNLITNFVPALEMVMFELPECNERQQQRFFSAGTLTLDAPSCRPAEPVYGIFIEQANSTIPAFIEEFPDEFKLDNDPQADQVDWKTAKQNLQTLAFFTQASWIAMLVIFVIAVPMGARSLSGVFNWAGWPVLFAGFLTLVLAVLLLILARGALPNINPMLNLIRQAPAVLSQPIQKLIGESLRFIARPLLFEAGALVLLGGVAVVVGIVLKSKTAPKAPIAPPAEASPPPETQTDPDETLELSGEELNQPPEEDQRPSGMFG